MTAHQLPAASGTFARYLGDVAGQLDHGEGWCAIFWQRDPDGMRACLEGVEIPPWDVVESLLHDLASVRGSDHAGPERDRARTLHAAAAAAHDRLPGGREALERRLEVMRGEQAHAAGRADELLRSLAAEPEGTAEAERLTHELAWTRDDHARAVSRITELTARLASLDRQTPPLTDWFGTGTTAGAYGADGRAVADDSGATSATTRPSGPGTGHGSPEAAATTGAVTGGAGAYEGSGPGGRGQAAGPATGHGVAGRAAMTGGAAEWAYATGPTGAGAHTAAGQSGTQGAVGGDVAAMPAPSGPSGTQGPFATAYGAADAAWDPSAHGAADAAWDPSAHGAADAARDRSAHGATDAARDRSAYGATDAAREPADGVAAVRGKKKRRRGARFAGVEDDGGGAIAVPVLPVADDVPRGARYGGAAAPAPAPVPAPASAAELEGAGRAARETVAALGRLRAEGRGGEAHVVLCEAAARPAAWLPALAAELDRGGLTADWATLLWEVASQPAGRLAAAADALTAAGRPDDGGQLLRQGVSRPAEEIADAAIALAAEGLGPRARALLVAYVQVHPAEDAAGVVARDPARLLPVLLDAAREVSPDRKRDLVHALRVAGYLGT
ncbi:hypothetical protein J7E88_02935 [Streptomyces sp. ISL-10]|uniref:hypothetical protein n=1 Tax=Streptomyces sp. ISL-10 TaxID=2819172 RepID=UPI001BE52616|nr:hypothetical protein [Streptomyces sp. ISL-10]MBT2364310.1 hypothetical protein [Streptomyces sp. ISL-10]